MNHRDLALVQGLDATRATLRRWNAAPGRVVGVWVLCALGIAAGLLYVVWAVSHRVAFDPSTKHLLPGLNRDAGLDDVTRVITRNLLVLALHALACVAGFIAGFALPEEAERRRGLARWVHAHAGPAAIAFVAGATIFSLATQAYVLGSSAAIVSNQLGVGQATLMLTLLPHALPELTALFLPLAAWLVASRRRRFDELLAATLVTSAIALPVLVVSAVLEVYLWPSLMEAASPVY